ncbi:hypothetical protein SD37_34285 [Amycolatopsis orientalis]|uniref:dTDP-4-dehydro-6-deoxy-alpha-D-glucopyranose 2,3-dehydratase domain-containing protein n=1 Tax=Amycolatopsis orientalis TaxID=31958 RepID=A0A193C734_AMYOR|nr:NDP-hexose 2,3-dehydratase family protein [Amycolatopsis orientalis]ANN20168.1 hypothetical protein SD37_34285 [Amycolatopsis orientalis]
MTAAGLLSSTAERFTRSAEATDSPISPNAGFAAWFAARSAAHSYTVERVPLTELPGWGFEPGTGDLRHTSGRFFGFTGVRVRTDRGDWEQPIIDQPEIGILGLVTRDFGGVPHFLVQAKMEPGNTNLVQLSTTVQATRGNYLRAHQGLPTPHLEHFLPPRPGRVLVDRIQAEHSQWFLGTHNRNMVVETDRSVPIGPDHRWLTLGQLWGLLGHDNLLNSETRTVLSCVPVAAPPANTGDPYRDALRRSLAGPGVDDDLLTWFNDGKGAMEPVARTCGLAEVGGWRLADGGIEHESGRHFRVVGVRVEAPTREVTRWSQPLIEPATPGLYGLLVQRFDGVLRILMHARADAGSSRFTEFGPTVQCCDLGDRPVPFRAEVVAEPGPGVVRHDSLQSEKGGRFLNAVNRYRVVELPADRPVPVPDGYRWLSLRQALDLMAQPDQVNIQARTLLTALLSTW